jgi:trans-aconitate 2-methyltransferase
LSSASPIAAWRAPPTSAAVREAYLARYETAIAEAYPAEPDGTVLLPFPRLFFVATR